MKADCIKDAKLEETGFRHSLIYAIDKIMEKKHSM